MSWSLALALLHAAVGQDMPAPAASAQVPPPAPDAPAPPVEPPAGIDVNQARASENAVTQAEDAFGFTIDCETLGVYTSSNVRGFSPLAAGNVRVEGLYFDQFFGLKRNAGEQQQCGEIEHQLGSTRRFDEMEVGQDPLVIVDHHHGAR